MMDVTPKMIIEQLAAYGLTQKQIQDRCGISQASVSRLLAGTQKDSKLSTLRALEKLLADIKTDTPDEQKA